MKTSLMRWKKPLPVDIDKAKHLEEVLGVSRPIASLLVQRDITSFEQAKSFFRPRLEDLHDPFLMRDMDKAVQRIQQAIAVGERLMVYGDYDVDGTTSVALVSEFLRGLGAEVTCYIPDRYDEGYGVSFEGINRAREEKISLIIALDCGIKAIDKVAYAAQHKIDFVICDHHRPGEMLPEAVAVLNPKRSDCPYPYKDLCGCGVGFKLVQALAQQRHIPFVRIQSYLDLVATAIGADIVPVTGENRILAYHGLRLMNDKARVGFEALKSISGKSKMNMTDLVFCIAPRINAAGRMKHGMHAVALMVEEDEVEALRLAKEVEDYNRERKAADQQITAEALALIEEADEAKKFSTVVYREHWHKGVIGIVASRLMETYFRPTLVFTRSGDRLAASARSVPGFDVYEALEACREHLIQFGGHQYAAGLTLEEKNYHTFKEKFEEVVSRTIKTELLTPELEIHLELSLEEITPKLLRILKQFEPFGPGNPQPQFLSRGLTENGLAKCVGAKQDHLRCSFRAVTGSVISAIGFNLGHKCQLLTKGDPVRIAYLIEENHFRGKTSLQLRLLDIDEEAATVELSSSGAISSL